MILIVSLTALVIAYLTKQFQDENTICYKKNHIKNKNLISKKVEKEKTIAEILNGRFAMVGLIAALGAYVTTGQIIPGFV